MASYKDMEVDVHGNKLVIWDLGPKKPGAPPTRPVLPKGEPGSAEYDLSTLDFREDLEKYEGALLAHRAQKKEYEDFQRRWGGPYEIFNVWWVDAREMLHNGRCGKCAPCAHGAPCANPRYVISASSPGHSKLPNRGLPDDVKPGRGQEEQMKRIAENRELFIRQKQQDPVFGQEEMRS